MEKRFSLFARCRSGKQKLFLPLLLFQFSAVRAATAFLSVFIARLAPRRSLNNLNRARPPARGHLLDSTCEQHAKVIILRLLSSLCCKMSPLYSINRFFRGLSNKTFSQIHASCEKKIQLALWLKLGEGFLRSHLAVGLLREAVCPALL